jgi:flavin reductase (DIM6/NTAB) family NADH-FMN oxidoreductase RutF
LPDIDPRDFRNACGHFPTGVIIITTRCNEEGEHGMTANSFMSISLDPPLIAVAIGNKARMLSRIRKARRFAVSILPHSMAALALHFSGKPNGSLVGIFEDYDGLPIIRDAMVALTADVAEDIPAGDHAIFVGRVHCLWQGTGRAPLIFSRGRFAALESPLGTPDVLRPLLARPRQ